MPLSPVTRRRLDKFRKLRRAHVSFWVLLVTYGLTLFADLIANNQPLAVRYGGKMFFPVLFFYSGNHFGLAETDRPRYKEMARTPAFAPGSGNWILFAPVPYGYNESLLDLDGNPPTPPTRRNLLGTDDRGRDILTRLIHGYRISFSFALLITLVGMTLGIMVGALQGYLGGIFDITAQRVIEIVSALPFLYIVIIVGSSLGSSILVLLIVFAMFNWIGISYYMRSEFYRLREVPFVEAARAMGLGRAKIMFRHILPNALTPVLTFLPFELIGAIFALSALDFLGFGLPAPAPSWGELMRQGMSNITSYWLSLFPAIALFAVLLLIAFVGEGVRDAFDPKEFNRME